MPWPYLSLDLSNFAAQICANTNRKVLHTRTYLRFDLLLFAWLMVKTQFSTTHNKYGWSNPKSARTLLIPYNLSIKLICWETIKYHFKICWQNRKQAKSMFWNLTKLYIQEAKPNFRVYYSENNKSSKQKSNKELIHICQYFNTN